METGKAIRTLKGCEGEIEGISMSSDGRFAISGSRDKNLMFWNLETGEPTHTFTGHADKVYGVSLHSDSRRAISASDDKPLILWDVDSYFTPPPAPEPAADAETPQTAPAEEPPQTPAL
jgi:WD40 repeat protein